MKDWEAIRFYTKIVEAVEELTPYPDTDDAWEERQRIHGLILGMRKTHVDAAYSVYLEHDRKPWCDLCDRPIVWAEHQGWRHVTATMDIHVAEAKDYIAGCEAQIIKRLKFEI